MYWMVSMMRFGNSARGPGEFGCQWVKQGKRVIYFHSNTELDEVSLMLG